MLQSSLYIRLGLGFENTLILSHFYAISPNSSEVLFLSNNRDARYALAARALGEIRHRNRLPANGGCGCPIIIEGRRDTIALRKLGFTGPIEQVNRGWDQSKFVTHIYEKYGILNLSLIHI